MALERPGPFDPGPEFDHDSSRAEDAVEGEVHVPREDRPGPGPFDPGPLSEPREPRRLRRPAMPRPHVRAPKLARPHVRIPKLPRTRLRAPKLPRPRAPSISLPRPRLPKPRFRPRLPRRARVGILVVLAVAGAIAVGIEIPRLLIDRDDSSASHLAAGVIPNVEAEQRLSAGTPPALATGPFFPIVGKSDIGEGAARFGASRGGRPHEGQDLFAKAGTPLIAVRDGVVVEAASENSSTSGGRGNYIGIYSPLDKRTYVYLHMIHPSPLHAGDRVEAGQQIGGVGCTGSCYGVHLHFEIRLGNSLEAKAVDPLPIVRRWPLLH